MTDSTQTAQNVETTPQHTETVDLLVIGWGKGGKTLAGAAAKNGQRVAVVEQDPNRVGGTCINVACVPTKILIHDAESRRDSDDQHRFFADAVQRRDSLTAAMRTKNFSMLDDLDTVLLVYGYAEFTNQREVLITGGPETLQITAETVLINTGTEPSVPPIDGALVGGRIHTSETLQSVSPLPESLVVVGGGYVGLEFASMFAQFGSSVTVLDRGERALANEDSDVAEHAVDALRDAGADIITSAEVTAMIDGEDHAQVSYQRSGQQHTVKAHAVLLALGRSPVTSGLDLERAGVNTDERGFVVVDEHLRTSADGVFALGDVNGGPQFTYVSLDDHRVVQDQIFGAGKRSTADRVAVPYTMFLTPPLARVGLTEDQARQQGYDVLVGAKPMSDIAAAPRAKIEGDPRGLVKVVVDARDDQVLGAALMHVHSQEVINLVALAMRHGVTASALRDSIYTHPSATEALNEVLGQLSSPMQAADR